MKKIIVIALLLFGFGWANSDLIKISDSPEFKRMTIGITNKEFLQNLEFMLNNWKYDKVDDEYVEEENWLKPRPIESNDGRLVSSRGYPANYFKSIIEKSMEDLRKNMNCKCP